MAPPLNPSFSRKSDPTKVKFLALRICIAPPTEADLRYSNSVSSIVIEHELPSTDKADVSETASPSCINLHYLIEPSALSTFNTSFPLERNVEL